jgi:hypothetical protein
VGLGAAACGHKGPPLPPLRPVPVAVSDWSIERRGSAIRLHFRVPDANTDKSTPPAVDRVEVFALSQSVDVPPPTPAELLVPAHLVGTVSVRSKEPAKPGAPPDVRPAAGDIATFVDAVAAATDTASPIVRYYSVEPSAARRRGPASPILRVPLSSSPAAPSGLKTDYTEQTLTITWEPAAAGQRFIVEETDDQGAGAKRLSASLLETPSFDVPVQFGQLRCFTVRAVEARGGVSIVGDPSPPVCVTARDRFPPPAPAGLLAVAGEGGIELVWTAVTAPDLGGYIVLRGDGANGTLQPIMTSPIAATSYVDPTVRSGATYVYAVIAVDTATPPNESAPSNRQVVAARAASPSVRHER